MKRTIAIPCLLLLAVCVPPLCAGAADTPAEENIRDILGVSHVNGRYHFDKGDFLNEGADRILALGSRVIKVWFVIPPERSYPFNSDWPQVTTLVDLAKSPYYRKLFDKPFTTFILMAFSTGKPGGYFTSGVTDEDAREETSQFRDLGRYLLTEYGDTDKTFVIQHWEGDWLIRGHTDSNTDPTGAAIDGMIKWLNARQAGITDARNLLPQSRARVYHAAEVNIVLKSMNHGKPNLVNRVLPHTKLDLVSYSAWDATAGGVGRAPILKDALDFIAANTPDSAAFGDKNVYVGEFGLPENNFDEDKVAACIKDVTATARQWGCPYVVYWQLYCNELLSRDTPLPVTQNNQVRGFWLIKPQGQYARAWHVLSDLLN